MLEKQHRFRSPGKVGMQEKQNRFQGSIGHKSDKSIHISRNSSKAKA